MSTSRLPTEPDPQAVQRILRRILIGVAVAGLIVLLVASTLWLQKVGREEEARKAPEVDTFREKEFRELERRQLMRCGLRQVDHRAEAIWSDIEVLETEAKAWHAQYEQLLVSQNAKRLGDDPWVVRYFWDQWGKRLPSSKVGENSREELNELMLHIRQAIADPNAGYKPTQVLIDEVGLIEMKVADARRAFHSHRRLMDALVRMIDNPKGGDQNTIKAKVEELDAQQALLEHGYPGAKSQGPADAVPPVSDKSRASKKEGGLDDLYEGVQRSRTGLPDNFGKTTLTRDAVPERRPEATNDGPLYRPPASNPVSK